MPDLADSQTMEIQGSAARPYVLKNLGGVYSCSCPAWRNQSLPIDQRTCKHLKSLRGETAEAARVGGEIPPARSSSAAKPAAPPLLLAEAWTDDLDPRGYWLSEKLDGVRTWWDGTQFLSRNGNRYFAPAWFTAGLLGSRWMANSGSAASNSSRRSRSSAGKTPAMPGNECGS